MSKEKIKRTHFKICYRDAEPPIRTHIVDLWHCCLVTMILVYMTFLCWSRRLFGILKCELYFHCTSTELWTRELFNITGAVNSEAESLWCVNEVCDFLHLQDSLNVILRILFHVNCIFHCYLGRKNFQTKIMLLTLKKKNTREYWNLLNYSQTLEI